MWTFLKLLAKVLLFLFGLYVILALVGPFVLKAVASKGPEIAVTLSAIPVIGRPAATAFAGWVFALRANPALAPSGESTLQQLDRGLDAAEAYVPSLADSVVGIFGDYTVWVAVIMLIALAGLFTAWRAGGLMAMVQSITRSLSTWQGVASIVLVALLAGSFVWSLDRGAQGTFDALRPILPLILVIVLLFFGWQMLKNFLINAILVLFVTHLVVAFLTIWSPGLLSASWVDELWFRPAAEFGLSLSSGWSEDNRLVASVLATLGVLLLGLWRWSSSNGGVEEV
ncbi:MAG: hypothetical protein A2804_00220 [Candidatus Pacebacteria bacterium RIFCSPHIGHO2_01_FULL_46_10]|uniref:Uncharacterized protein n=2 Tax=Katanobacteria TaxID=422282 RepID=A0A0G0ZJ25_UNCKA|nr:MAG: hypothetical protein UU72_C0009G0022 [candidate division WWE3 bacterium GW2011_GWB1_41_6]KKS22051.1 MAG: hypothetical protein UU80_C0014G0006 [candidate division WWE3 bacterium GW2011_GWA1_41_8]OGJ22489.1 MAG: hypothetical protein A2804_00220 [Candidatus Pacebacteria bacterium RIFCSPHIGHO2_01_FULL_46_10]